MSKKIVCITGTVWSADDRAPRNRLVEAGFLRPVWFTTSREITDGDYERINETRYHLAEAEHEVLVRVEYGGGYMGVMKQAFDDAFERSKLGVLVVGPPEVAVQIVQLFPNAIMFAFKCVDMKLSSKLEDVAKSPRFHRIDVESWKSGAWSRAFEEILDVLEHC